MAGLEGYFPLASSLRVLEGVAGQEGYFPLASSLRVLEGVAGQEASCLEDLLLRVVGWRGSVTRVEKTVGWNVKLSPSHMALPVCSGVSQSVS